MTIAPPLPEAGFVSPPSMHGNPSPYSSYTRSVSTHSWGGLGGQWGSIAAGAVAGLAVAVLMATLGSALGLTASAIVVPDVGSPVVTMEEARNAAVTFGIGTGVWVLITAAAVGLAGGAVLAKMAQGDRPYSPMLLGVVTWALGISFATILAVGGASGLTSALGAGSAGAAAAISNQSPDLLRAANDVDPAPRTETETTAQPDRTGALGGTQVWTAERRATAIKAAEAAATAAATAAWFAVVAQLIALGATVWAASSEKFRSSHVNVVHQHA